MISKLNSFLDKLDKDCPHVINKIETYGEGKILQVIIADTNTKVFMVKKDREPGLYKTEKDKIDIIEILYKNNSEKKKYTTELVNMFKEKLNNKIVYVTTLSQTKTTLLLQLYVLDKVKPFTIK